MDNQENPAGPDLVPNVLAPFFETARREPARPAVVEDGRVITYGMLAGWARSVADAVAPPTAAPQPPVGVVSHHSVRDIAALFGVLAAGRSYVPIEGDLPPARLTEAVARVGCREAVATAETGFQPEVGSLIRPRWPLTRPGPCGEPAPVHPDDPAYTLFTSGSTGDPKAVVVPHAALNAVVPELRTAYGVGADETVLQFHGAGGDTSLEEILPALTAGAMLVIDDGAQIRFTEAVDEHGIGVAVLPTDFWYDVVVDLLAEGGTLPPSLHTVVVGGEAVRADMLERWHLLGADRVRLVNTYGSTETGLVTHAVDLAGPKAAASASPAATAADGVPIGFPLPHVVQRIVRPDEGGEEGDGGWGGADGTAADAGRDGELYLSGPCLALGYLGNPVATAARFQDTDLGDGPRRWYRTGDLVHVADDGALIFRGRRDHQVKIRGYRVHLGEVEYLIGRCAGVEGVAAAAVETTEHTSLAAFVVLDRDDDPAAVLDRIRTHLADNAPRHLTPSRIVPVPGFEHTHTGKVDRNATRDRYLS